MKEGEINEEFLVVDFKRLMSKEINRLSDYQKNILFGFFKIMEGFKLDSFSYNSDDVTFVYNGFIVKHGYLTEPKITIYDKYVNKIACFGIEFQGISDVEKRIKNIVN